MPVSNGLTANLVCTEASPPVLVGSGIRARPDRPAGIMSGGTKSDVVLTHIGYRDEVMGYKQGVKERLKNNPELNCSFFRAFAHVC